MNSVFTRRSVRAFLNKKVEDEKVELLLKAAMQAPSAANQQPWEFIVVRGKENLAKLSEYNPYAGCLKNANLGIIVVSNKSRLRFSDYWQQDLSAATQNILLEATELGLGSVWFGTAPDKERISFIKNLYKLDDEITPFSVIAIGYPEKEEANSFIDRFDKNRISYIY